VLVWWNCFFISWSFGNAGNRQRLHENLLSGFGRQQSRCQISNPSIQSRLYVDHWSSIDCLDWTDTHTILDSFPTPSRGEVPRDSDYLVTESRIPLSADELRLL